MFVVYFGILHIKIIEVKVITFCYTIRIRYFKRAFHNINSILSLSFTNFRVNMETRKFHNWEAVWPQLPLKSYQRLQAFVKFHSNRDKNFQNLCQTRPKEHKTKKKFHPAKIISRPQFLQIP